MALSVIVILLFCSMSLSLGQVPMVKLNDGSEMPALALGTFLGFMKDDKARASDKIFRDVICEAIDIGYRHFDTAAIYNSEAVIGEAIRMKIANADVKREDIFVTTKLWSTHHESDEVLPSVREQLKTMGLSYIDLYLMHWPMGFNDDYSASNVDYLETWRSMEHAFRLGLVKHIGVSNFNKEQLERLIKNSVVMPAVLQTEVHLQLIQEDLIKYAQNNNITVMGYSPFGSLVPRFGIQFPGPRIDDPAITTIAQKYGKTSTQVILRWHIERNVVPVPKTTNIRRLKENINIYDFKLTEDEIKTISSYNTNFRYNLPSFWQNHPYYPFEKVDNPVNNPFIQNKENQNTRKIF